MEDPPNKKRSNPPPHPSSAFAPSSVLVETMPRRTPKQSRSRATVTAILDAMARLLCSRPLKAITTNHVADLAGVNIASLYHYFPRKEAVLRALAERSVDTYEVAMRRAFSRATGLTLEAAIPHLLRSHFEAVGGLGTLHRILVPRLAVGELTPAYAEVRERMVAQLESFLRARHDRVGPGDLAGAARTCVECVEGVTLGALARHGPELTVDPSVAQLPRLARRYLLRDD